MSEQDVGTALTADLAVERAFREEAVRQRNSVLAGTLSTEDIDKLREMHGWLAELMPAARVAIKMLNARESLAKRWRGAKS
jgi:hypothetical protein